MSDIFPNVVEALKELKRHQPECASEVDVAIGIIFGKRPGIEEKYRSLLLKLDRAYFKLIDKRDLFARIAAETKLYHTRRRAESKVSTMNILIADMQWMRARNRDMVEAIKIKI